mmetsp:Transcript_25386/g.61040  ORF Transcript_25386/g.61040 Transcript_25386/m.61040 type:complete len:331 (+) Transcript_25386:499-1491(+)
MESQPPTREIVTNNTGGGRIRKLDRTCHIIVPSKSRNSQPAQYPRDPHPEQPPNAHGLGTAEPSERPRVKVDQRLLVLHIPQHGRGSLPTPLLRLGARALSHLLPVLCVHERFGTVDVAINVAWLNEEAGIVVTDQVGDAARCTAHDRDSARHALQDDETERFRITGHHEHIGARERRAQLIPAQLSGEHRFGVLKILLQLLVLRSPPHHAKSRVGHLLQHRPEVLQPFLSAQPSDVHHQKFVRMSVRHSRTHLLALKLGVEPHGVDTLSPHLHAGDAVRLHLLLHLRARHEREVRPGVCKPYETPRELLDAGDESEVIPSVQGQVGVVR